MALSYIMFKVKFGATYVIKQLGNIYQQPWNFFPFDPKLPLKKFYSKEWIIDAYVKIDFMDIITILFIGKKVENNLYFQY